MEIFKIENLSFSYPGRTEKALSDINLCINQGEFILLCGISGCGKTTLLRLMKSALAPIGETEGTIYFDGKELSSQNTREQAARIGFVMQNPDNQLVTDKVWHELAFGLESLGCRQSEIRIRVAEMASFFGIQNLFHKKVTELSGGQKQLLNLASVMVMQPSVLILDEPASQLDPIAASEFFKMLEKINRELGTTVIISDHRLEDTIPMADRIIVMDNGKITLNEAPHMAGKILKQTNHAMYKALPAPMIIHSEVENSLPCPLTVKDARSWLEEYAKEKNLNPDAIPVDALKKTDEKIIELTNVWFRYEKNMPDVIKGFNLSIYKGELLCMLGGNGSGKTTLLSVISGLNKAYRGKILINGKALSKIKNLYSGMLGVLPQNPQSLFVMKTVHLELMETLNEIKLTKHEKEQKIHDTAVLCRVENLFNSHPYDLSGGEQQRVALAKILLKEPEILILDEPTKGMDAQFKEELASILLNLRNKGTTIIMVSHDIEFCAKYADRCALIFDGQIASSDTPRNFFTSKNFYTTQANRMARGKLPNAVLTEDIILACGTKLHTTHNFPKEKPKAVNKCDTFEKSLENKTKKSSAQINLNKRFFYTSILIPALIPLTIYAGVYLWHDRKYYFTSLLIILEAMVPFALAFETRKPRAREIVLISVLCTIAVAGRMAFFMLPQFKPVVAVIIITGVCLSAEAGFLVGALSGFISNFFFGQGPWTPWQMFAFGIIGFVAGILAQKNVVRKNRISLCTFGFLATFILYGGIMNPASVIMWQNKITREMIISTYITGLPFDLVHAFSTSFFLWFISTPMAEKLERIKTKYGLVQ